jgi:hypothetical protein
MFASDQLKQKVKTEVELVLDDGTVMKGSFFLNPQQRILDILNDERAFLPFEDVEGVIIVILKTSIRRIKPDEQKLEHAKPVPTSIGQ